jgi:hypothetical protein
MRDAKQKNSIHLYILNQNTDTLTVISLPTKVRIFFKAARGEPKLGLRDVSTSRGKRKDGFALFWDVRFPPYDL